MSDKTPFQVLGITEEASFEEVQAARDSLLAVTYADEAQQERIEQAYDMILMQRLRLRKEGKIAVPDRIRFAERATLPQPNVVLPPLSKQPTWIRRWLDSPSMIEVVAPAGILAVIAIGYGFFPSKDASLPLALSFLICVYFLYRKEHKIFRSILLSLLSMGLGYGLGSFVAQGITSADNLVQVVWLSVTFFVMWLVTAFLR